MSAEDFPLTKKEFNEIYSKVPRLTVEIIVKNDSGAIYLTKRAIEPCKGRWHLPGGTVLMGEKLLDSVKRIARRELNIKVKQTKDKGYIEYPDHYKNGLGYPVGVVFEVEQFEGSILINEEAQAGEWHKQLPDKMHPHQDVFLLDKGYLRQ